MFDIGFWELALIGVIALIVLGPERLPDAARTLGRWVGRARQMMSNVKQDLDRELQGTDLAEFKRLKEELNQAQQMLRQSTSELAGELNKKVDFEQTAGGDKAAEDKWAEDPGALPKIPRPATDAPVQKETPVKKDDG
jgi:sec-independent protein translocase protein TatB